MVLDKKCGAKEGDLALREIGELKSYSPKATSQGWRLSSCRIIEDNSAILKKIQDGFFLGLELRNFSADVAD